MSAFRVFPILVLIFAFSTLLKGQTYNCSPNNYSYVYPQVGGAPLTGIHFYNDTFGAVIGGNSSAGFIALTTDGGVTFNTHWVANFTPTQVQIVSPTLVVASGTQGRMLKSTDGGKTFNVITTGTQVTLNSVSFVSDSVGWLCGELGIILKTTNGGASFTQSNYLTNNLFQVKFISADTGYLVGRAGTFAYSFNGGATFVGVTYPNQGPQYGLITLEQNKLYTFGAYGFISGWQVTSGNWTIPSIANIDTQWVAVRSAVMLGADEIWFAGSQGKLLRFKPSDKSKTNFLIPNRSLIVGQSVANGKHYIATADGAIYTRNQADTTFSPLFVRGIFLATAKISDSLAVAFSDLANAKTINLKTSAVVHQGNFTAGVKAVVNVGGVLVASFNNGSLGRSADTARTFGNIMGASINALAADANGKVWACGNGGRIATSADTGKSWQFSTIPSFPDLNTIIVLPTGRIIVAGKANQILISDDGNNWSVVTNGLPALPLNEFKCLVAKSADTLFAAGGQAERRCLLKSTNGGLQWSVVDTSGFFAINHMAFNGQFGIGVGVGGSVITTTNGGLTWQNQVALTTTDYNQALLYGTNAYFLGENENIIKMVPCENLSTSETENDFNLNKEMELVAYPNPINHSDGYLKLIHNIIGDALLHVYGLDGRLILEDKLAHNQPEVYVGHLKPGLYLLMLRGDNGSARTKILIE